jgi:hypothetical protein
MVRRIPFPRGALVLAAVQIVIIGYEHWKYATDDSFLTLTIPAIRNKGHFEPNSKNEAIKPG